MAAKLAGQQVWFITGAGRGMGADIVKAALAAGHAVVATGREPKAVEEAVGRSKHLFVAKLDVTRLADAQAAVRATIERLGRIDVLVNNAGNFYAGFFEELSPDDVQKELCTLLARRYSGGGIRAPIPLVPVWPSG